MNKRLDEVAAIVAEQLNGLAHDTGVTMSDLDVAEEVSNRLAGQGLDPDDIIDAGPARCAGPAGKGSGRGCLVDPGVRWSLAHTATRP